jgi:RNA recognition motif-containing protein
MGDVPNKRTIYVGNVGENWEESVLIQAFQCFGPIETVSINTKMDGSSRGNQRYAIIAFEEFLDATAAIDNMNENILFDRTLRVALAKQ